MNEFLDNAVAKLQDEKKSTMKKDPRMNQDDLQHRKFAEKAGFVSLSKNYIAGRLHLKHCHSK